VDRFFLGGPARASAHLAPPSACSAAASSGGPAYAPPAHLGLRGFAAAGCGPRATPAGVPSSGRPSSGHGSSGGGGDSLGGDALGGDLRCAVAAELTVPAPLPALAAAGVRGSASVQAGLLAPNAAALWNRSNGSFGGSFGGGGSDGAAVHASASVGVGIPLGAGAGVEVVCSVPLTCGARDRPERWQLAIGLGIGS
jgi:outer membrane protein assembly factor BamA